MGARGHAARRLFGGKAGAHREAAAQALGHRHDVGGDARLFMGEQGAGAAHAGLHLVEDQQQAELVGGGAQAFQVIGITGDDAALALDRLDQDGGGLRRDGGAKRVQIAIGHVNEARRVRIEALEMLFLAASRDGRQRAPVKGAGGADDLVPALVAALVMVFARHLDGALIGLGARVAEEHGVGKGVLRQRGRHRLLAGHPVQVRGVPQPARLVLQGLDQMGMAMAQRGHRDARTEIQESSPVARPQIGTLAPFEGDIGTRISGHHDRKH